MVICSYKSFNGFLIMLKRSLLRVVHIWEIWPTTFWIVRFLINNEILPKNWPIIFMHGYCKLFFQRNKSHPFQVILKRKHKSILCLLVWYVFPFLIRSPLKRTPQTYQLIEFCQCDYKSIFLTVTFLMERLTWKFVLGSSI